MMKGKKQLKRRNFRVIENPKRLMCSNCNEYGSHFVAPSFGERGFFACERVWVAGDW